MIRIALLGYGKMGKTIDALINQHHADKCEVVLRINSSYSKVINAALLRSAGVDVAIEFSRSEAVLGHLSACFEAGVGVVCGTTGWLSVWEQAREQCLQMDGALLWSANFSIGVHVFFEINRQLASLLAHYPQYHPSVEEIHHVEKLDRPSGTALVLAKDIVQQLPHKTHAADADMIEQLSSTDAASIVPIFVRREADVKGTHTVRYESASDQIEIKHQAHTREGFAVGAIAAALWLHQKKGVFEMKDVLGF